MVAKTPNYPDNIEVNKGKETLKETITKLHEHITNLTEENHILKQQTQKLNNRLQLIKAQADVGFV